MWAGCAPNLPQGVYGPTIHVRKSWRPIGLLSLELQSMGCHMNGFLDLAVGQSFLWDKARPRMSTKDAASRSDIEKGRSERDHQLRAWKQWRRERLDARPARRPA